MRFRNRKLFAAVFLLVFGVQTFYPCAVYALTSGPAQPEMQKFTPAGTSDMVDLFTGDFKENIPLLDVGGYPVNLSYHSGTGMEEEASWVGTGWSLNPGTVNRQLRGLPDDFDGDPVSKTSFRKPFKKAGGQLLVKPTLWGYDGLVNPPTFSLDVYKDNYYGFGAAFGASVSFKIANCNGTRFTGGLDFSSDSRDGVNVKPTLDMERSYRDASGDAAQAKLSGSFLYNTRAGLKSWSLEASFNTKSENEESVALSASYIHPFGQTYIPELTTNTKSENYSLGIDVGPYFFGGYVGFGGKGYVYKSDNTEHYSTAPAYGYLNYLDGKANESALLDINHEKDGVFIPSAPSIEVPVATEDLFSVTGQAGSGQFRPYFAGNYIGFDKKYTNTMPSLGAKVSVGGGWIWQLGGRLDITNGSNETKKWTHGNDYVEKAEFVRNNDNPLEEPAYFKQVGEATLADKGFLTATGGNEAEQVHVSAHVAHANLRARGNNYTAVTTPIKNQERTKRNFAFSYLNAVMASKYALDPMIQSYGGNLVTDYPASPATISRRTDNNNDYKYTDKHMSEVTVTDNEGKRMVYGIPVINKKHEEFAFAVNQKNLGNLSNAKRTGLIPYTLSDPANPKPNGDINPTNITNYNPNGRDGMVEKDVTPAYATSFLLTGVLSPDYVDVDGNGISDNDLGTAYKFNYKKIHDYHWRAPFAYKTANYNEGLLSDPKDDRGNIVYGEKELWYMRAIESKTMIAIFETSNREDGLGVIDENGGPNNAADARVLKLDAIKLYSKADWAKNGAGATPIKVVHFEYDYSLYPNVTNNTGNWVDVKGTPLDPLNQNNAALNVNAKKGKLTLKKIYFTFGTSTRGTTNPYLFDYDMRPINPSVSGLSLPAFAEEANDWYGERQGDRWGTYKQSWYNNPTPSNAGGYLSNAEYPYALQKNNPPAGVSGTDWSDMIDRMASKWQLNKITTPSGSIISVVYESDDYAFVQDREAMQMYRIKGLEDNQQHSIGLSHSQYLDIELPAALVASPQSRLSEFIQKYLDGTNTIFFKVNANMKGNLSPTEKTNHAFADYVSGYAEIDPSKCIVSDARNVKLYLNKIAGYSPIAKAAWQKVKADLPQYAYNGYDNSDLSGSDLSIVMEAIYATLVNFRELWHNFDLIANNSGLADNVDFTRSFVRLKSQTSSLQFPDGKRTFSKTGGGSRVRKIEINDQWHEMAGSDTKSADYGQEYNYTTSDKWGNEVSSGVASYEPQGGNEENPFHQPVSFTEKVHWGIDRYHAIEKPYGESYFPSAMVGYSKVKVTSYGDDNTRETGYVVNEFYTARDFPTLVDILPLENPSSKYILPLLLYSQANYLQVTSQGVKVELNDMHGKPKAIHVVDNNGREISSTEYFYRVMDQNAERKQLNNENVPVLMPDGTVVSDKKTLATDVDFVSDSRQSLDHTSGTTVGIYPGGFVIPIPFAALYIHTMGVVPFFNYTTKDYYSMSTVKVISRYGILTGVKTTKNGSSIMAENTLWDGETGEVLLTRTQNEFNDYTYAFHYPAYMAFEGMGGAAKNLGAVFSNFSSDASGVISIGSADPKWYLFPGDELINTTDYISAPKGWVIVSADNSYRFVDKNGNFITTSGTYAVLRSGKRNLLGASVGSIVCMNNPVANGRLNIDVAHKILDAKAVVYREKWAMPKYCNCPEGYTATDDGNCILETDPISDGQCRTVCAGSYEPDFYTLYGTTIYTTNFQSDGTGQVLYRLNYNDGVHPSISNALWREVDCSELARSAWPVSPMPTAGPLIDRHSFAPGQTADTIMPQTTSSSSSSSPCLQSPIPRDGGCGPLTRTAIWVCAGSTPNPANGIDNRLPLNTPVLFSKQITIPADGTYYVGLAGDDTMEFAVDGNPAILHLSGINSFYMWQIYPVLFTAGTHTITFGGVNTAGSAAIGCEIYNNSAYELANATYFTNASRPAANPAQGAVYLIFSTKDMIGQTARTDNLSCPIGYSLVTRSSDYICRQSVPVTNYLNPYFTDMLGNWHPASSSVYTVSRVQKPGLAGQNGGTDIRHTGYYNSFTPFWLFNPNNVPMTDNSAADNRWVWSNASVNYDSKGNEIESVDPLGHYGAALFGYRQSLATVVAANARHNEVAFDGFEDYDFKLAAPVPGACQPARHFDFGLIFNTSNGAWSSPNGSLSSTYAHTGKWSLNLTSPATFTRPMGSSSPIVPFLGYDNLGRYQRLNNEMASGFAPVTDKEYLLSLWVHEDDDANPVNTVQKLTVKLNGNTLTPTGSPARVEGWKRLEVKIPKFSSFQLELVPSGSVYVDDIRIMPLDGQIGTYVYDATTLRLAAQLDENNFATFYEYDAEGTPVRVKKETERGIMTLKENRQSYKTH